MEPEIDVTPKRRVPWVAVVVVGFLLFVAVSILGPVFSSAFQAARQVRTLSNFRMLHTAWIEYSVDYDDRACLTSGWNETLIKHKRSRLLPEHLVNPMHRCGVFSECMDERQMGLNKALGGFSLRTGVEPSTLPIFSLTNLGGSRRVGYREFAPIGTVCACYARRASPVFGYSRC